MKTIRIDTRAKTILLQSGSRLVRMVGYLNKETAVLLMRNRLRDGFQMTEFNPRDGRYVMQMPDTQAEREHLYAQPCALKKTPITHGVVKVIPIFDTQELEAVNG